MLGCWMCMKRQSKAIIVRVRTPVNQYHVMRTSEIIYNVKLSYIWCAETA